MSPALLKDLSIQLWHTAFLYALAFIVFRLMGKRSISHLAPFDIAVVIIIGEAVAIGIEETSKSILTSVVPIVALGILQFGLTYLNLKWRKAEKVTQGIAGMLVKDGKTLPQTLAKEHISEADLLIALRQLGYEQLAQIKIARIEPTGQISALPNFTSAPVTNAELGLGQGTTLKDYIDQKFRAISKATQ